jgi:two-component system, OmpR family, sensor kinase
MPRMGLPRGLGWARGRTLSAKLIAIVAVLLAGACAIIGFITYVAVRGSLVSALDGQLATAGDNYAYCVDGPPGSDAQTNFLDCLSAGQPQSMLGVLIQDNRIKDSGTVYGDSGAVCHLSAADIKTLLDLPVYRQPPGSRPPKPVGNGQPPPSNTGWGSGPAYTIHLSTLDADYRVTAVALSTGETVITGLPMSGVQSTLSQVARAELIVFPSVLLLAGVLGTVLVRLSLRPLRRVAATATRVTELPLDSGEVTLPAGVPYNDPRSEVGQVGAAFNRMLGHVERALGRRAASEARLRRFAADASHELRTPLSAIRGYAELALRHPGPVPEEVTHALSRVQSESARMSVLVDELLLLARLDAGRPLERKPVDLSRMVIEVTSDAQVARRDHRWRLDLPDYPVLILGDEFRLHQVLANLLSNAGKHTPPGTTVTVALAVAEFAAREPVTIPDHAPSVLRGSPPPRPRVVLSVTDDGPGIPAELLPELFERFTRADTSRARDGDSAGTSTGLGLAIVDAVVTAHHGCVSVTSRPGATRFAITLPLPRSDQHVTP